MNSTDSVVIMLSTISLLGLSLILCHQVNLVHGLPKQDGICKPFNKSSGLAEVCGYNSTAKFIDISKASSYARYYGRYFGNCTKTIRQVLCSRIFPRCEPDVKGPFLPCKRVLLDTLSKCGEEMRKSFSSDYTMLKWLVNLLPENNDPTTSNSKKRCFEPANFKTDVREGDLEPNKCFPLVVPRCQKYGYKFTIYPEEEQKRWVQSMLNATSECEKIAAKIICYDWLPPCYKNSKYMGDLCRTTCQEYFKRNCSKSSLLTYLTEEKCGIYPEGSQSDQCKQDEWSYTSSWPGALSNTSIVPTTQTTISSTISSTSEPVVVGSSVQQKASNVLISGAMLISFAVKLSLKLVA